MHTDPHLHKCNFYCHPDENVHTDLIWTHARDGYTPERLVQSLNTFLLVRELIMYDQKGVPHEVDLVRVEAAPEALPPELAHALQGNKEIDSDIPTVGWLLIVKYRE